MEETEKIDAFASDLDRLVERYRKEFCITYAAVVGTLHIKASLLCNELEE